MIGSSKPDKMASASATQSEANVLLRAIVPFLLLALAVYGITTGLQRRRYPPSMRNDVRMYAMLGSPMGMGGRGGGGRSREGEPQPRLNIKNMEPQALPRFFATLARTYGDYTISVRQVIGTNYQQNIYNNRQFSNSIPPPPLEQFFLSMQVLTSSKTALQNLKGFDIAIQATDNTGKLYVGQDATKVVRFKEGIAQIVRFPAPASGANRLSVRGDLLLTKNGKVVRLPYQLETIPLPTEKHIFGTVALATLTPEQLAQIPPAPDASQISLVNDATSEDLQRLFPPYKPEPTPLQIPWRILLQPTCVNRMDIYLPKESQGGAETKVECTIKPFLFPDGEISGEITFQRGGKTAPPQKFRVWDDEPYYLLLPRSLWENSQRPLAMRLHLFLDLQNAPTNPEDLPIPLSPFPAKENQRGATLEGTVSVGDFPLERTIVSIEVMPLNAEGASQSLARKVRIVTGKKGKWVLANFAPGSYRVRLSYFFPQRSELLPTSTIETYFQRRFGVGKYTIQNATQADVLLRPGGRVHLKPWRIVPTAGEEFHNEQPHLTMGPKSQPNFLKNSSAMMSDRFARMQQQIQQPDQSQQAEQSQSQGR